ncbi:hypothetical protein B0H17DRAFT_1113451 [Mycena rosella]|uniref:Uncharacterized protein n=1 Tax=Mycena rosella TaxID=1033263 RepID=A0AAD7BGS4_MYCRO|nr:hypothetical protein B0H17DRAFT_1113451 [Mycena rosella]
MVREFGLFATTFRRPARQEIIAPNSPSPAPSYISVSIFFILLWETTNLMVAARAWIWTPTSPRPTASDSTSIYLIRIVAMERQSCIRLDARADRANW